MSSRDLTEILSDLYRALTGEAPPADVVQTIDTSREDNGFDQVDKVPAWMPELLEAVLAGREAGPVVFPADRGDAATFLDEVAAVVPGWTFQHHGEWIEMAFPPLGVDAVISNEARGPDGKHARKYLVRPRQG